jgi:hypothetical protein
LQPFQWLEQHSSGQGRARQIFILTDGEITNVSEVLNLCRSMALSTRIFSFGLGYSPSRSLVKGLAQATNGRYIFIPPNTTVDVHVGEQLRKALEPCITNVHVKWNFGTNVQSAPTQLPPVYLKDRLIVYGLFDDKAIPFNHNSSVELVIEPDNHRLTMAQVNRIPSVSNNETIARLAAKALILEQQHEKIPSSVARENMGSLQEQFEDVLMPTDIAIKTETVTKRRIIDLSLKYNILSPYTAFIGVEKRMNSNNAGMVLREVPIQIVADCQHLQTIQSPLSPSAGTHYKLFIT